MKKINTHARELEQIHASTKHPHFQSQPPGYKWIENERRRGYKFKQAVGEHGDNSSDAGASYFDVFLQGPKTTQINKIIEMDNGTGMDYSALERSFYFGGDRIYTASDKGRFGQGGTFGSLSFAAEKQTYTRCEPDGPFIGRYYDLEICKDVNQWGSQPIEEKDFDLEVIQLFKDTYGDDATGTILVHKTLDLITTTRLDNLVKKLTGYLGETFCEFIDSGTMKIRVNGVDVQAKDPLHWNDPDVVKLLDETNTYNGHEYRLQIVSLRDIAKREKNQYLSFGGQPMVYSQGGYAFRANRLIQGGLGRGNGVHGDGWISNHADMRYLRWRISFDFHLDDAMGLDNQKTSVNLVQGLNDQLATKIKPFQTRMRKETSKAEATATKKDREKGLEKTQKVINDPLFRPKLKSKAGNKSDKVVSIDKAKAKPSTVKKAKSAPAPYVVTEVNFGGQAPPVSFEGTSMQINLDNPVTQEYYVKGGERCRALFQDHHASLHFSAEELPEILTADDLLARAHLKMRASTRARY